MRSNGSKLGVKIDQKSIPKRGQLGKASLHRFFFDFGGFWEPSWEGKSSQDRRKSALKIGCKTRAVSNASWSGFGRILAPKIISAELCGGFPDRSFSLLTSASFSISFFDAPRRSKTPPGRPQDAPRRLQDEPKHQVAEVKRAGGRR